MEYGLKSVFSNNFWKFILETVFAGYKPFFKQNITGSKTVLTDYKPHFLIL